jgi:type II secretory pathway component GspD/PulD (secretin)
MNARKILFLLALMVPAVTVSAQLNTSRAEEQEVQRLLALPDLTMRFQAAPLDDVLRTLCEASDMAFIGLPKPKDAPSVDMTIKGNPYQALLLVSQTYGYVPLYENGLWHFSPLKEERSKLFPKVYKLKNIHLSSVQVNQKSMDSSASRDTSSALPSPVNSQAFNSDPGKVIEDIKALLELDPANFAISEKEATAPINPAAMLIAGVPSNELAARVNAINPSVPVGGKQDNLKGRIIADPDQNALFIIATKEHHQWIETYLTAIDIPQKLILLETRFVSVSSNPTSALGIDWSALDGYDMKVKNKTQPTTTTTSTDSTTDTTSTTSTASNVLINSTIGQAVLSSDELSLALHAISTDTDSRTLQHPSQVTVNNRQVVLRNVRQYPFSSGSSSSSSGGSSNTTQETEFIPIGTTVSLLPRILDGNNVELNIMINVSEMIDLITIGTGQIPETSSRDYSGQAIVATGNTLAIGGLDTMDAHDSSSKVPLLGDIPLLGRLFSNKTSDDSKSHLVMFITASVLDGYSGKDGIKSVSKLGDVVKDLDKELEARNDKVEKSKGKSASQKQYLLDK